MCEVKRKHAFKKMMMTLIVACLWTNVDILMAGEIDSAIQVHGDWVIEISSAEGELLKRIEFKNALVPTGQQALVNVFRGEWRIDESSPAVLILQFQGAGLESNGNPECNPAPTTQLQDGPGLTFRSGTISFPAACITNDSFTINEVRSRLAVQEVSTPTNVFSTPFTARTLDTPVTVLPDQQFTLQATFSFE